MFTGLIEGTGKLKTLEPRGKDMRLSIQASFDLEGFQTGESVAVDGVCLTAVSWQARAFTVDVSQETLSRSRGMRLIWNGLSGWETVLVDIWSMVMWTARPE
jgi:riboflavin synthase alpha subunit